jgi:hypothetical protein
MFLKFYIKVCCFMCFYFKWLFILAWFLCYVKSSFDEFVVTKGFGLSACCDYVEDYVALMGCVKTLNSKKLKDVEVSKDILVVTYISNHILSYASNFAFYNLFQLRSHHFPFLIFDDENSIDYYPKDRRWNKIKLLHDGLDSWGKHYGCILYLDADILLDKYFGTLHTLVLRPINKFSDIDVILSEDLLDYGNSGVLILKNTDWTRSFLQRWWDLREAKNVFCDQHALNFLSLQLADSDEIHHLRILPFPVINTKFPSIVTFEDGTDQNTDSSPPFAVPLVHFLGEYAEVRTQIGLDYSKKLCHFLGYHEHFVNENAKDSDFPRLLKIDLIKLKFSTLQKMIDEKFLILQYSVSDDSSTIIWNDVLELIKSYCQFEKDIRREPESSKLSPYDHRYFRMINETSGSCQRYYLSYSELLGNALHIRYMNFRQSSTSDWYPLLTDFLSFYDLKVSVSTFNITFVDDYSQKMHIYNQEYGLMKFLQSDLMKIIEQHSLQPAEKKKAINNYLSFSFIEKRITMLSSVCKFFREKLSFPLPRVIVDESCEHNFIEVEFKQYEECQIRQSNIKKDKLALWNFPLTGVNISEALSFEQILVSDLYSLIEYAQNETSINTNNPALQNYIFQYIESCGSLSKLYYLSAHEEQSLEWCELAVSNMRSLAHEYHGELRPIVNLQKSIYSQCAQAYMNINETKSKFYEVTGRSLRYHARNLSAHLSEFL